MVRWSNAQPSRVLGWSWRGRWRAPWWNPTRVWKVWKGGECCHLPGISDICLWKKMEYWLIFLSLIYYERLIILKRHKNNFSEVVIFVLWNKFSVTGETRWLRRGRGACQNFCRIPREHRGQEGKERPWWKVIVLKFHAISFHSFITDILVDGRCQLWSTTRRCTISKIFQPRRFLQNFPHMAGGSLKSKSCTRHGEAWLAVAGDTVYLFWPARSWHPWALKLFMYVKVSLSTYWRETIKMWMHIYENENIE